MSTLCFTQCRDYSIFAKIRESNGLTREITKELIWQNIFWRESKFFICPHFDLQTTEWKNYRILPQKFRQSNFFTKELQRTMYSKLIWRKKFAWLRESEFHAFPHCCANFTKNFVKSMLLDLTRNSSPLIAYWFLLVSRKISTFLTFFLSVDDVETHNKAFEAVDTYDNDRHFCWLQNVFLSRKFSHFVHSIQKHESC